MPSHDWGHFFINRVNLRCFVHSANFVSAHTESVTIHPLALNALCFLLEHQWMFEPCLIVVFESLYCPQCHCWKWFKYVKYARKLKNLHFLSDFFWRTVLSLTVQNKQGTHEQTVIEHPVTTHSIKNQGFPNFEGGYFNNFSNFFYVNIFYVKCLTVLNKNIIHFVWSLLFCSNEELFSKTR